MLQNEWFPGRVDFCFICQSHIGPLHAAGQAHAAFNAVATVMSNQIRALVMNSVEQFVHPFCDAYRLSPVTGAAMHDWERKSPNVCGVGSTCILQRRARGRRFYSRKILKSSYIRKVARRCARPSVVA